MKRDGEDKRDKADKRDISFAYSLFLDAISERQLVSRTCI